MEDHVEALIKLVSKSKPGSKYNISSGRNISNIDLCKKIFEIYKRKLDIKKPFVFSKKIHFVKDRLGHDFEYLVNSSKIKKELGWKREISFDKMIEDMVQCDLDIYAKQAQED